MKSLILFLVLVSADSEAQVYSDNKKEVLYQREKASDHARTFERNEKSEKKKREKQSRGNLPNYFKAPSQIKEIAIVSPEGKGKIPGLFVGDVLSGVIPHAVIAFPDEKAPVLAEVTSGKFKGATLVGSSRLEKNSKRVFIDFTHMTYRKQTVEISVSALTADGQPGFVGEYHSKELKYFTGDFLSSMTAAYFDSLVPRYRSLLGNVEDNSPDSALKKGLAAGAMASAERFREKLKKSPGFSVIDMSSVKLVIISI
jgi:hypothetical protein